MTDRFMPGPWKVGYRAMHVLAPSSKGDYAKVCDIRGWGYLTGKGDGALGLSDEEGYAVQKANAVLIAAAPDLLAALRWFIDDIDGAHTVMLEFDANVQRARAAIAKATEIRDV